LVVVVWVAYRDFRSRWFLDGGFPLLCGVGFCAMSLISGVKCSCFRFSVLV